MISVAWLIAAILVSVVLTLWITFTLTRLDRLHARCDAAWSALDAQLVRRAAALLRCVEPLLETRQQFSQVQDPQTEAAQLLAHGWHDAATDALHAGLLERETVENRLSRSIDELAQIPQFTPGSVRTEPVKMEMVGMETAGMELHEACLRLVIARRFYNDAVRDTRSLRERRMPRILRLAGHREVPQFFDIDDTVIFPVVSFPS